MPSEYKIIIMSQYMLINLEYARTVNASIVKLSLLSTVIMCPVVTNKIELSFLNEHEYLEMLREITDLRGRVYETTS